MKYIKLLLMTLVGMLFSTYIVFADIIDITPKSQEPTISTTTLIVNSLIISISFIFIILVIRNIKKLKTKGKYNYE